MLALCLLPHQKLDFHLREKRLHPPLPKEALSIKCQTVLLITLLREYFFQTRGEGRGGCPGGYAAVAVCEAGEFGGRGGARGGCGVQGEGYGDVGAGATEGCVEDVAGYWGFLLGGRHLCGGGCGWGEVVCEGGDAVRGGHAGVVG